jgi:hypothetical protein
MSKNVERGFRQALFEAYYVIDRHFVVDADARIIGDGTKEVITDALRSGDIARMRDALFEAQSLIYCEQMRNGGFDIPCQTSDLLWRWDAYWPGTA